MGFENFISSENTRLDAQLQFTAEIDKMTSILRRTILLDKSRRENDAEHSWHIGVMALLFEEYALEKVDIRHAVEICICHDLIEIYAGDTFAYDVQANLDKAERELAAADKLYAILPDDQGKRIRALWDEFEECKTADAKYANCLDRIQPFFHNTLTEGHTWTHEGVKTTVAQVEKRMGIVKEFMPEVYKWAQKNIDHAVQMGWLNK